MSDRRERAAECACGRCDGRCDALSLGDEGETSEGEERDDFVETRRVLVRAREEEDGSRTGEGGEIVCQRKPTYKFSGEACDSSRCACVDRANLVSAVLVNKTPSNRKHMQNTDLDWSFQNLKARVHVLTLSRYRFDILD